MNLIPLTKGYGFPAFTIVSKEHAGYLLTSSAPGVFTDVISIGSPPYDSSSGAFLDNPPEGFEVYPARKLRLEFDDVLHSHQGLYTPASTWDMDRVLEFAKGIGESVLVHCAQGTSRSPATALAILASLVPDGEEVAAVTELLAINERTRPAPFRPNLLMVELVDDLLDREGRLLDATREVFTVGYKPSASV